MKGMELSKAYFEEYGKPMIESQFFPYKEQMAAGLVGEGSECFGYDDEFSQDHDFGPGFASGCPIRSTGRWEHSSSRPMTLCPKNTGV